MRDALQFIEANKSDPFFLFLSYTIPHANNEAEERGMEIDDLGEFAKSSWPPPERGFAAMLQRLDRDVGRLLDLLQTLGIDGDTIVFFTSDNGPHHEGGHDPEFFDSNGLLRGVKRTLYEGGIRVPMLVRWPGHVPAGATSNTPAYFADVFPTFAELAGAKPPLGLDGTSFLAAALGRAQKPGKPLYWEFYEDGFSQAARFGRWKAVRSGGKGRPIELYDLAGDIGEKDNVAAAHPDLVAQAEAIFAKEHVPSAIWPIDAKDD
jgi:arylsulfatase A-like enzyme